jgi:hypothetical protein
MARSLILSLLLLVLMSADRATVGWAYDGDNGAPFNGQYSQFCSNNPDDWADQPNSAQVQVIREVMATRPHRLWHFLWHGLPGAWAGSSQEFKKFFKELSPEWVPPKSVRGVDFVYMHHRMVGVLFQKFKEKGLPCIKPWIKIPGPTEWPPVPAGGPGPMYTSYSDLKGLQEKFLSKKFLQGKPLDYVGEELRKSLHNKMHVYWAGEMPAQYEKCALDEERMMESALVTSSPCDDPNFDYLGLTDSSQVNPIFYKLHGLVEQVMVEWALANGFSAGVEDEAGKGCGGRPGNCYSFSSEIGRKPWEGKTPYGGVGDKSGHSGHEGHDVDFSKSVRDGMKRMVEKRIRQDDDRLRRGMPPSKPGETAQGRLARVQKEVEADTRRHLRQMLKTIHDLKLNTFIPGR